MATIQSPEGGGVEVLSRTNYFNLARRPAEFFLIASPCLYRTIFEINYVFYSESAQNYLFRKILNPPPPTTRFKLNVQ